VRHIPGVHNTGAVYLSRFQVEQFKQLSRRAEELPTPVPTHTFCQRIDPYAEGFVKFRTAVGHTKTLPESLDYFYCVYLTGFSFRNSRFFGPLYLLSPRTEISFLDH